jgi:hypothetical protein
VHFCNPVAKTVDDEAADYRVIAVDGVSTTRIVFVVLLVLIFQNVRDGILKSTEIQSESMFISFCGVVEYNV